jgi:outer membrane lipoprotein-sorting protein
MTFFYPRQRIICLALAIFALAFTLFSSTGAEAVIARTLKLSKQDIADLVRIEKHLNGIKTMKARFLQVSSNGEYSEGLIYLSRPGRMRVEYDPPSPIMVVADGSSLIYVDREMEQTTAVLLQLTPADLLLRDDLSLISDEILLTGFKRSPGVIRISFVKADDPLEGQLTLIFSDPPLELRKWAITDSQGVKTTVSLLGPRFGLGLDKKLFDVEIPRDSQTVN